MYSSQTHIVKIEGGGGKVVSSPGKWARYGVTPSKLHSQVEQYQILRLSSEKGVFLNIIQNNYN